MMRPQEDVKKKEESDFTLLELLSDHPVLCEDAHLFARHTFSTLSRRRKSWMPFGDEHSLRSKEGEKEECTSN